MLRSDKNNELYCVIRSETFCFSSSALIDSIKSVFAKGALFRFKVTGFSMEPFLKDSDVVALAPFNADNSFPYGQVVAFMKPLTEKLVIHRVVTVDKESYLVKGDNLPCFDGLISRENILGRVIRIERAGRRIHFGLGPERILISFLSKRNILVLLLLLWRAQPVFVRRCIKKIILL